VFKFGTLNEYNSTIIEVDAEELYGKYGKGKAEIRTLKDPIISDDGKTYTAPAIDVFENKYLIIWEVKDFDTTDESEACDWNNPIKIEPL